MSQFQIAQINIGRIKGVRIDDPIMKEFVDNLETVNKLAESNNGFIWRLKDENNNATSINPYNDEQIIINISVWATIQDLEHFVYKTFHTDFLEDGKSGLKVLVNPMQACGGCPKGNFPPLKRPLKN